MEHAALALQRITTQYVPQEDRLRLAGEGPAQQVVVLWLTQRLLGRLVPHLCGWLEQQSAASVPQSLQAVQQSFAQQAAMAALHHSAQAPVQVPQAQPAAEGTTPHSGQVVQAVDITPVGDAALQLGFKDGAGRVQAQLRLEALPLRQWLVIVQAQYAAADWPTPNWPQWLQADDAPAGNAAAPLLLH